MLLYVHIYFNKGYSVIRAGTTSRFMLLPEAINSDSG